MKGLLIKDFRLLAHQKQFIWMIVLVDVFVTLIQKSAAFALGYTAVLFTSLTLNTITYDESDNGNAFLFTLPVTRREYVLEKYLFGLCAILLYTLFLLLPMFWYQYGLVLKGAAEQTEFLSLASSEAIYLFLGLAIQAFLTPLQLKFGQEKARIALLAILFAFISAAVLVWRLAGQSGVSFAALENFFNFLEHTDLLTASAILVLVLVLPGLLFEAVSIPISIHVMEHKEF